MAELENNLETVDETVETVAEAGQPDAKKLKKVTVNLLSKVHQMRRK